MRNFLAVAYLIWVGWLIRKTEADEKAVRWMLSQFDALTARAARTVELERRRLDLTSIDPARVTGGHDAP